MAQAEEASILGTLIFHSIHAEQLLDFESCLFEHVKNQSTLGVHLVKNIIEPTAKTNNNLSKIVYCYHCANGHYGIASGQLVRRFYINEPVLASQLYTVFTVKSTDLQAAYWRLGEKFDIQD